MALLVELLPALTDSSCFLAACAVMTISSGSLLPTLGLGRAVTWPGPAGELTFAFSFLNADGNLDRAATLRVGDSILPGERMKLALDSDATAGEFCMPNASTPLVPSGERTGVALALCRPARSDSELRRFFLAAALPAPGVVSPIVPRGEPCMKL